jgi:hypothetical protein
MTKEEFDELMTLEKRDLIVEIWKLRDRVAKLEERNSDMRWARDEFRNAKDKMMNMISSIEMPRSY